MTAHNHPTGMPTANIAAAAWVITWPLLGLAAAWALRKYADHIEAAIEQVAGDE